MLIFSSLQSRRIERLQACLVAFFDCNSGRVVLIAYAGGALSLRVKTNSPIKKSRILAHLLVGVKKFNFFSILLSFN